MHRPSQESAAIDFAAVGPTPDRAAVRRIAEAVSRELAATAQAGGNVYQRSLELSDKVNAFRATLTPDAALHFAKLYAEEMEANAQASRDRAAALLQQKSSAQPLALQIAIGLFWAGVIVFFGLRGC